MTTKKGRCDDHQPEAWQSSKGKTATERGYGHNWRKARKQALERDGHLCQECIKQGVATLATDVDHIQNKASGGTDDLSNLQSLCNPCHKAKTIKERSSGL
jgi:5-methylcytosine-specific restriction enzyme A